MNAIRSLAAALIATSAFAVPSLADQTLAVPALANQTLTGTQAHELLAGRQFEFVCVDGTRGQASYSKSGAATASYRPGTAADDAQELTDRGRVRINGESICIRWQTLNGGDDACFRMTKRSPGTYRIAEGQLRWCDLSVSGSLAAND